MAIGKIDTNELEYLKSCRNKLRDIVNLLKEEKNKEILSAESRTRTSSVRDREKIKEIKKILKQ